MRAQTKKPAEEWIRRRGMSFDHHGKSASSSENKKCKATTGF
jgi:hypothetical protein